MTSPRRFGTVITCIDGRFQKRVQSQVVTRVGVRYVDTVTSAGAVKHFAGEVTAEGRRLLEQVAVSIDAHDSKRLAIVAHGDCAGNPVSDATQKAQLEEATTTLSRLLPEMTISAFFLDPGGGFERVG